MSSLISRASIDREIILYFGATSSVCFRRLPRSRETNRSVPRTSPSSKPPSTIQLSNVGLPHSYCNTIRYLQWLLLLLLVLFFFFTHASTILAFLFFRYFNCVTRSRARGQPLNRIPCQRSNNYGHTVGTRLFVPVSNSTIPPTRRVQCAFSRATKYNVRAGCCVLVASDGVYRTVLRCYVGEK